MGLCSTNIKYNFRRVLNAASSRGKAKRINRINNEGANGSRFEARSLQRYKLRRIWREVKETVHLLGCSRSECRCKRITVDFLRKQARARTIQELTM